MIYIITEGEYSYYHIIDVLECSEPVNLDALYQTFLVDVGFPPENGKIDPRHWFSIERAWKEKRINAGLSYDLSEAFVEWLVKQHSFKPIESVEKNLTD